MLMTVPREPRGLKLGNICDINGHELDSTNSYLPSSFFFLSLVSSLHCQPTTLQSCILGGPLSSKENFLEQPCGLPAIKSDMYLCIQDVNSIRSTVLKSHPLISLLLQPRSPTSADDAINTWCWIAKAVSNQRQIRSPDSEKPSDCFTFGGTILPPGRSETWSNKSYRGQHIWAFQRYIAWSLRTAEKRVMNNFREKKKEE